MRKVLKFFNGKERCVNVCEAASGVYYISWCQWMRLTNEASRMGYRVEIGKPFKPVSSSGENIRVAGISGNFTSIIF